MEQTRSANSRPVRLAVLVAITVSLLLSISVALVFHHRNAHGDLLSLSNLVGPTTNSLLHGNGLAVTTRAMGTDSALTFHAARMPVASVVVAMGVLLFGAHGTLPFALVKTVLFLAPIWGTMCLVLCQAKTTTQRWGAMVLLLLPFGMLPFLADVVNLQVEEGYSYSTLALATAMLLFPLASGLQKKGATPVLYATALGLSLDVLFLSKSSMIAAAAVLTAFAMWQFRSNAARVLLLVLVCAAPLGWALHQRSVSGRASLGTSLDGINLHKGNNDLFLDRYPPAPGDSLDRYDSQLSAGIAFQDEWAFNDYHKRAAVEWIKANPALTVRADVRKAVVFFATIHKVGSADVSGSALMLAETGGMVLFRILLLASIVASVAALLTGTWPGRADGLLFLLVLGACAAPYVIGFAYTRHASVLIYPAVILLCRFIMRPALSVQHLQ